MRSVLNVPYVLAQLIYKPSYYNYVQWNCTLIWYAFAVPLSPLQNEMMASASSKDSVLSRLTLAAYETQGISFLTHHDNNL